MAERKVLSKWYPPDFDPSAIERSAKSKDGKSSKLPNVRLMTPFSMKCTHCGEYIPKGRKFNARKEVTDERYLSIQIIRFYIRCTRCSGEITFRTDPKNNDYQCENGAKRNFEVWRDAKDDKYQDETEEQTLDRLEKEHGEKEDQIERDKMAELEDKMLDSKREMKVADALDEIRTRNARIERKEAGGAEAALATAQAQADEEALRAEQEAAADAEAIRQEFREKKRLAQQAQVDEEMRRLEEESAKLRAKPFVVKRLPRRSEVLAARQALFDQKRPLDAGDSKGILDKKRPLDAGDFKGIFDKKPRKE
ncbi:CWC16 protein [Penicillium coprophilum]|uniref:CWC16 protein n=1 Tax=Penicillium coprophilum TaxID=36646 RepID=UPI00238DE812|nr:CWC16 protein [Penicillium coprophilum]KAJ5165589.1 CWC16 protein [Penicillium coprophilum]